MYIEPTAEQIHQLGTDGGDAVCMVNLLRFRTDGGRESYQQYGEGVLPLLAEVGGEVLWQGSVDSVVIGDVDADAWDLVVVVRYPSRNAFLSMVSNPAYAEAAQHRTNALADSRLIACTER